MEKIYGTLRKTHVIISDDIHFHEQIKPKIYLFIGFSGALTSSGSYGHFQLKAKTMVTTFGNISCYNGFALKFECKMSVQYTS